VVQLVAELAAYCTVRFVECVSATKERPRPQLIAVAHCRSLLNRYFRYNDRFGISIWPVAGFLCAPAGGVFSNSGVSLKQPGIGNAKRVDPL
jgi:hypothetical protein